MVLGAVFHATPADVARTETRAVRVGFTTASECVAYPSNLTVASSVPDGTVNVAGHWVVQVKTTSPAADVGATKTVVAVPSMAWVTVASMCWGLRSPLAWLPLSARLGTVFWGGTVSLTEAVSAYMKLPSTATSTATALSA